MEIPDMELPLLLLSQVLVAVDANKVHLDLRVHLVTTAKPV